MDHFIHRKRRKQHHLLQQTLPLSLEEEKNKSGAVPPLSRVLFSLANAMQMNALVYICIYIEYISALWERVCVFLWSADTRYTFPGDGNFSSSARQPSKYQMCVSPFLQNKQTNTQKGMRRRVSKSDDDNDRYWFSSFSLCSLLKKTPLSCYR